MLFSFVGGTAQQRLWFNETLLHYVGPGRYPGFYRDPLNVTVEVSWVADPPAPGDDYACTTFDGSLHIFIQEDLDATGGPRPGYEGENFYKQTVAHEIGHCIIFRMLTTEAKQDEMCALFGAPPTSYDTGPYLDQVVEATAETIKDLYLDKLPRLYDNFTNRRLPQANLEAFCALIVPVDPVISYLDPVLTPTGASVKYNVGELPASGFLSRWGEMLSQGWYVPVDYTDLDRQGYFVLDASFWYQDGSSGGLAEVHRAWNEDDLPTDLPVDASHVGSEVLVPDGVSWWRVAGEVDPPGAYDDPEATALPDRFTTIEPTPDVHLTITAFEGNYSRWLTNTGTIPKLLDEEAHFRIYFDVLCAPEFPPAPGQYVTPFRIDPPQSTVQPVIERTDVWFHEYVYLPGPMDPLPPWPYIFGTLVLGPGAPGAVKSRAIPVSSG